MKDLKKIEKEEKKHCLLHIANEEMFNFPIHFLVKSKNFSCLNFLFLFLFRNTPEKAILTESRESLIYFHVYYTRIKCKLSHSINREFKIYI